MLHAVIRASMYHNTLRLQSCLAEKQSGLLLIDLTILPSHDQPNHRYPGVAVEARLDQVILEYFSALKLASVAYMNSNGNINTDV
jgi:hypothetical protein